MTATTAAAPTETAAGRSRRLLVLLVVVVLGAGAFGAYTFLWPTGATEDVPAPVEDGPVLDAGTLTTNLAGATDRYARVGIALVLSPDADPAAVEARLALVKDAALTEIASHDVAELAGPDGMASLRSGLDARIGALFPDGAVLRVALTEFVLQ